MKVDFKKSFLRDLKRIKDRKLLERVRETIELVEQAKSLQDIKGLKRLKSEERYYRIRIGDYRLGILIQEDMVVFVRCLHRKDIYKYFP